MFVLAIPFLELQISLKINNNILFKYITCVTKHNKKIEKIK